MRGLIVGAILLLAAGGAVAAETKEIQRGEYRFAIGPEPAYVVRHDIPQAWEAGAPGATEARWRYWLYDIQSDRRDNRDQVYVEHAYEPRSSTMLGEAGRFQIVFNPVYQTLTIHRVQLRRDGTWQDRLSAEDISLARRESSFEQDMTDGRVTAMIVLDDVRVGDVVRIGYTIQGSNPILAGQVSDWIRTAWRNPMLDSHLRVLHDPGSRIAIHREHAAPQPKIVRMSDRVEVLAHAHAAAARDYEDNYPNWYQPYPLLQVDLERDWSDVVAWALPLYPRTDQVPADLLAQIAEWNANPDPFTRMTAALRAVQDKVRYFGVEMGDNTHRPVAPAVTWQRRFGDCKDKAYLLVTLLERLQIDAVPALVSTTRGRALQDFVPSASDFDHVIVRATIDGKSLWLDPTMSQQGGDPRDVNLVQYGVALPIADGVAGLEQVAPWRVGEDGYEVTQHFVPSADERSVQLIVRSVYRGYMADHARRSLANQRPEDISRQYADYYRKLYGDLDVDVLPVLHDDRPGNELTLEERYSLADPYENESGMRVLEVYGEALDAASSLPPAMDRASPLFFGLPAHFRQEIKVDVPTAWHATFGHESSKFATASFDYQRTVEVDDRSTSIIFDMVRKQADIAPDNVPRHIGELRKVRDELSAQLRFKPPAGLDRQEREERLKSLLQSVLEQENK